MKAKKIILLIVLISLFSISVNADIFDGFRNGLSSIEDFFTGGWQNYEKTMIFLVFFFLFFATYLMGMKKVLAAKSDTEGKVSRPGMVFAFVAAFLSAFIIAVSVRFDWLNLEYVAWGLIALLILFLIHSLLMKLGMENHKFWAFLLALLLTALLLWLIWSLMQGGRPLEALGRVGDWFGGLGRGGGGGGPLVPGETPGGGVPPSVPPSGEVTPGGKVELGKSWWIILAVILAVTAGAGGIGKLRGRGFLGGVKDLYRYPQRAYRRGRKYLHNRRLRKFIERVLKLLPDQKLTERDRQEVLVILQEAINLVARINERWLQPREQLFKEYRDRINRILRERGIKRIR